MAVSNSDDLDKASGGSGRDTVDNVKRESAHEVAPSASDMGWVSIRRLDDALTSNIEFSKKRRCRLLASLAVPSPRSSRLSCGFGVELDREVHELASDDAASLTPGDWLDRPVVQLTDPLGDLRLPNRCHILVDYFVEALDQGARERCPSFGRQSENLVDEFLRVRCHEMQSTMKRRELWESGDVVDST